MLREVIGIVEMDNALFMRLHNIFGKKDTGSKVFRNLACHVVALNRVYRRVLIGVFLLYLFIVAFDEGKNLVIGSVGMTLDVLHVAVNDVPTGNFGRFIACALNGVGNLAQIENSFGAVALDDFHTLP